MTITSDTRKPYSGNTRSLVLAFDVGTTFSGVSYAILEPNEIPKIHGVTRFPGQEHVAGSYKIPTLMYYDPHGNVKAAGAEAEGSAIIDLAEDEGWTKAELFKLRLRPQTMKLKMNGMRLPSLPKGKSAVQVFGDYLGYLFRCTKNFITDTHANGSSLWRAVEEDLQFVLSHPNGWEGAQQTKMRRAAVHGGLIPDTDAGKARIRFVTEGEASLHACVLNGLAKEMLTGQSGHGFLVADAGGGTLDISSYAVRGTTPLVMEEIAPPDCVFAGSVFVSRRARAFFEDKLRNSKYGTQDTLEHITKRFDETTKRLFRDKKEPQYVQFGSPLDKDPSVGIRQGQLKLTGAEVAELFEPSIEAAITSIKQQIETTSGFVKSVWLVGGFAASPWLFGQLQERLEPLGITVSRPDNQTSKAVADGAIGFYCDHHVSARMSKFIYGVEFLREYDPEDPDHLARQDRMCELPSGPKLLADAFDCILARGIKVKESSVFTRKYCTEVTSLSTLSVFEVEIWCYRGGTSTPMWINRHAEDFSTLCIVQADLSPLAGSAQPKPGKSGKTYWTIVFSVEIHFGLTEFRARIKWVDSGRTRYGPASIVYNEGGQRAEEDDLNDDDPAASAYVSRAPSPPPAPEPQLPVPERSYLEVPNASTSNRSSRSRGSPPEPTGVDKGKGREDAASGGAPSRSLSISRSIPGGIELPGPIALTDSNSSRRSGSGRLGETLSSIWGNIVPSAGPSANSSILPSPLEGPTSRNALLNALKPLASVPEGSAIPDVIHADASVPGGVPEVYRSSPPKTPKAESAAATSPKPGGTPKAVSRAPTTATSPRPGGTPRGLSIYSNVNQPPPAAVTPRDEALGTASPAHVSPSTEAPPVQPTMPREPEMAQIEVPAVSTPRPTSRAPTKPPTRAPTKPPTRVPSPKPSPRAPSPQPVEPQVTETAAFEAEPSPAVEPAPVAVEPPSSSLALEPVAVAPAATEEEDPFPWGQAKSKAASRKGSKATSKAASKAASKVASKAPSPKGAETPRPQEVVPEEAGVIASEGPSNTERAKPPSGSQTPLATVPEDTPTEAPPIEGVTAPGSLFVANPDEGQDAQQPPPPGSFFADNLDGSQDAPPAQPLAQPESHSSFSSFGNTLGGGVSGSLFGAATSVLGWGKDKSKPTNPKPAWGSSFGSAVGSVAESTGGSGWGAATGNNSGSNSAWLNFGNKSANASSADLLSGAGTTDFQMQTLPESVDPHSQASFEETQVNDAQEWDVVQDGLHNNEPLTVETNVTAETAGPTTGVGDSPEEGRGGDEGEGGEETGEKAEEDEWTMPVRQKKKKGGGSGNATTAATPITPSASGGGDDAWATTGKKKKGKKK